MGSISTGGGMPRVLLIAYACEPGRGSEPGTGWNLALGLAKFHHITVATRANNRPTIEKFLETFHGPRPEFLYVDPAPWVLRLKQLGIFSIQLFYYFWQRKLAHTLAQQKLQFDILHQLTFNSFEIPPFAFTKAKGLKIWGPIGGGQTVSRRMLPAFGKIGAVKELLRNLRVAISARNPVIARTLGGCSLVLFANKETEKLLSHACHGQTGMMIDVGVDVKKFSPDSQCPERNKTVILFAGRLEGRKGTTLLIRAFAQAVTSTPQIELRIVGDGPERKSLENEAQKLNIQKKVIFVGSVSHSEMNHEFQQADIFAFPSLRDTSGAVVLEAMAMRLPVVCFDHQGAALMVTKNSGIKVAIDGISQSIDALSTAILSLARDPKVRETCGSSGRTHAGEQHDWDPRVLRFNSYYRDLISRSSESITRQPLSTSMNPGFPMTPQS